MAKIIEDNKKLHKFIKWKPKYNMLKTIVKSSINWEKNKNMKKIFIITTFFLLFVSQASANNLELAKLLRDEKDVIDAGWDNPNSLWVVFLQEEITVNYSSKSKDICKIAKENFNIKNKFEMTFASKVTKQTFKTYKC